MSNTFAGFTHCPKCGGLLVPFSNSTAFEKPCTCKTDGVHLAPVDPEGDAAYWRARAEKAEAERDKAWGLVNAVIKQVMSVWPENTTYVDPVQGVQAICDALTSAKSEFAAMKQRIAELTEQANSAYAPYRKELELCEAAVEELQTGLFRASEMLEADKTHITELEAERDAAREEAGRLREAQRWIPVSERLPEAEYNEDGESIPVQGFCNAGIWEGVLSPVYYIYRTGHWYFGQSRLDTVTHWRPLPEPPAESEEEG